MKKNIDYEQLYYDAIYENRKLKQKIEQLESEIQDLNICRTKRKEQGKQLPLEKY